MSKTILSAVLILLLPVSQAEEASTIDDALRIVVVGNGEGIHYAHGCYFYELRSLLSQGFMEDKKSDELPDAPLYEVRLIGKSGVANAYIGDHWISIAGRVGILSPAQFDRILVLIEDRKGQGVRESALEESVQAALSKIQDSSYLEDNRCSNL